MSGLAVVLAILGIYPHMNGNNRQCIVDRQVRIAEQLEETVRMGVPVLVMAAVAFKETHFGCDRNEGGGWGAPIDRFHRHTAGTHVQAAQSLINGRAACGSWEGAVLRFRTGACAPRRGPGPAYLREVLRLEGRIESWRPRVR